MSSRRLAIASFIDWANATVREFAMISKSLLVGSVATVAFALSGTAAAQACAGFSDVLASSSFCPNVEWLKNRGVTTGCGAGTTYCPNDSVTRLQMAIFMNRLGTALTPVVLTPGTAAASAVNLAAPVVLCQTPDYAVTGAGLAYPRRAYVHGTTNLSLPTANVDGRARVLVSTNGGGTWAPLANSDHYATLYTGSTPGQHATLTPFGWVDVNVGQTVRFGLDVTRFLGTGNVTASCAVHAQIGNRNGTGSPFDQ